MKPPLYYVCKALSWLLREQEATLWHPESPGGKVKVRRTIIGRMLKNPAFATLSEALSSNAEWRDTP